jgi:hypothetical protein
MGEATLEDRDRRRLIGDAERPLEEGLRQGSAGRGRGSGRCPGGHQRRRRGGTRGRRRDVTLIGRRRFPPVAAARQQDGRPFSRPALPAGPRAGPGHPPGSTLAIGALAIRATHPRAPLLALRIAGSISRAPHTTPMSRQSDGVAAIASRQHSVRLFDATSAPNRWPTRPLRDPIENAKAAHNVGKHSIQRVGHRM